MKGSLEGVLPMLGLLILSVTLATQSIPLSDALADVVSDSTSDIERVVETRAFGDFYFYNYVPLAGEYSSNDAAYDLGQESGGLKWNNSMIESASASTLNIWRNNSSARLNLRVGGSKGKCKIPDVNYTSSPYGFIDVRDTKIATLASYTQEKDLVPIRTKCKYADGDTFYQDTEGIYSTNINATGNRYLTLSKEAEDTMEDVSEELSKLSGEEYTGDGYDCGSRTDALESAEEESRRNMEDEVQQKIQDAMNERPSRDFLKLLINPTYNFYVEDADWNYIEGDVKRSGETEITDTGDCDCDEDGNNCDTSYEAEADASPVMTDIEYAIRDEEYQIVVRSEYKKLEFRLDHDRPYTHYW